METRDGPCGLGGHSQHSEPPARGQSHQLPAPHGLVGTDRSHQGPGHPHPLGTREAALLGMSLLIAQSHPGKGSLGSL